jgi:hypothetical protein
MRLNRVVMVQKPQIARITRMKTPCGLSEHPERVSYIFIFSVFSVSSVVKNTQPEGANEGINRLRHQEGLNPGGG